MRYDLFKGLVRIHVLYHASKDELYGLWIIEELRRHGYNLSPGTLYPILHKMEEAGYIESRKAVVNGKVRRLYKTTSDGDELLKEAKIKVKELFGEIFENEKE
jgi:DNA-binding PadR family transcriptional regulator